MDTSCTYTYTYAAGAAAGLGDGDRAEATTRVDGRTVVVASGRVRDHRLVLKFKHVKRGRYKLTLLELGSHHDRQVVGHTSLDIS